jgi:iron complex transport system ATP-binding protein
VIALEARDLYASYGPVPALRGLSLRIEASEFLGVLGPNGSGKSTLVKALSRVIRPDRGTVSLDGRDLWRMGPREVARQVAVVPQETPVAFEFTVEEVVLMGRSPHLSRLAVEGEADRQIARAAMTCTDTLGFAARRMDQLSGGERQRVALARALAQEPRALFLDEPTAHLDLGYQMELLERLVILNRERGVTLMVVLHDLNLAAAYCPRLVLLSAGRVAADGTPEAVLTAERLRDLYRVEVAVRPDPVHGRPHVYAVRSLSGAGKSSGKPA